MDLTQFIKQSDIRQNLLELVKKPEIAKPELLFYENNYNATLLGYAIDFYIKFKYDFLYQNKTSKYFANELSRKFYADIEIHTRHEKNLKKVWVTSGGDELSKGCFASKEQIKWLNEDINENDSLKPVCTLYELHERVDESIHECNKIHKSKSTSENFYKHLILLAKVIPGIKWRKIGNNPLNAEKENIKALESLIKLIPDSVFKKRGVFLRDQHFSFGFIDGRPDYILDNEIFEIKTTKDFFTRSHFNQVLLYYFLYKCNEKKYKKKNININKISIYYPLYGKIIEIIPDDILTSTKSKQFIKYLKLEIDDLKKMMKRMRER